MFPPLTAEQNALVEELGAEHGLSSKVASRKLTDDTGAMAAKWVSQIFQLEQNF